MNGSGDGIVILISLLSVLLSFLVTVIILGTLTKKRMIAKKRLLPFYKDRQLRQDAVLSKRKKKKNDKEKKRFGGAFANELQASGILMSPEEFATFWLVASFVPSGLIAILTGKVLIAGAVALVGIAGPPMYVKSKKKKRTAAFEQQLGDALVTMCNCLRSGLTLGQAIENISTEMAEPISKEFARVCVEVKYGSTLENALNALALRVGSDDLSLAVTAINIQRQTGGNLSEILSSISETIRARVKLKADVKVVTATGKASGIVIGILPIALGLIIFLVNPNYMVDFVKSGAGKVLLGIAAFMEVMGFLVIRKILTIKY